MSHLPKDLTAGYSSRLTIPLTNVNSYVIWTYDGGGGLSLPQMFEGKVCVCVCVWVSISLLPMEARGGLG